MYKIKNFLTKYYNIQSKLLNFDDKIYKNISKFVEEIKKNKKDKKKIFIFGNGGSAAIANHFSIDLTKNAKFRCINLNESSTITCLSNDFGYEKWVSKSLEYHADNGDLLILVSSSGVSKNLVNAIKFARKQNKIKKIISFTGMSEKNYLNRNSDISFHIKSNAYNLIENTHQIILLSVVDFLIGKLNYSSKR
jgi:D-sedoheptulose 7-phosphate isomerase